MFIDLKSLNTNRCHVDCAPVKKWAVFFTAILCSLVTADVLSQAIGSATGMTGWMMFLVSFILYALFFFATLLCLFKKYSASGFWFPARMEKKGTIFV